jgi:ferredoxin-thioredoxin reductase catalytic subunit
MQELAHRHSQRMNDENQKFCSELDSKMHDLDSITNHLDEVASHSSPHRRNYDQEKEQVCVIPCFCYEYLLDVWKLVFSSFSLFGYSTILFITGVFFPSLFFIR